MSEIKQIQRCLNIEDVMNEDDKNNMITEDFEVKTMAAIDGELLAKVKPGMIVQIQTDTGNARVFVLSMDRKEGVFCGSLTSSTSQKDGVYIEIASTGIQYDGIDMKKDSTYNGFYISTSRIETYPISAICGYDVKAPVLYTTYIKVLNGIIENFGYEEVAKKYEEFSDSVNYEKYKGAIDNKLKTLKKNIDPKALLIQNMQKAAITMNGKLETANKQKEAFKKEINQLKQDYKALKADYNKQKSEAMVVEQRTNEMMKEYDELKEKYHELLEKYASVEKDPKMLEENDALKTRLKEAESEMADLKEAMESLRVSNNMNYNEAQEYKLKYSQATEQSKDAVNKTAHKEDVIKKLSEDIAQLHANVDSCNECIAEKDAVIESLKNNMLEPDMLRDTDYEKRLINEIEELKKRLEQSGIVNNGYSKEYTLIPDDETAQEALYIPYETNEKLKRMLAPVPENLRSGFIAQMVNHFEESIKNGDVTVNMVTKLTY